MDFKPRYTWIFCYTYFDIYMKREHFRVTITAGYHGPVLTGSFSFRVWSCITGGKRVKGFVLRGALLPRHAPHEPKPFLTVGHHDSTASAPHRGFRRDSRLSLRSGQTPSLARHALAGLLCDVVWLAQL